MWAAFAVPVGLTSYLCSEAPVLRFHREQVQAGRSAPSPHLTSLGIRAYDPDYAAYRPAHWLFDNTPLQSPLRQWARLWGVENEAILFSVMRSGSRPDRP